MLLSPFFPCPYLIISFSSVFETNSNPCFHITFLTKIFQFILHQFHFLHNKPKMSACCSLNATLVHFKPKLLHSKNPLFQPKILPILKTNKMGIISEKKSGKLIRAFESNMSIDEDEELCPVDCVREFYSDEEFLTILEKAKLKKALVVVDFYRTSCGSCKYIEQGFRKLCRGAGDRDAAVIFLKHNVIDEYDEQSEVAERLRIKAVPLFQFYKDGVLLEAFPTRDKERVLAAIQKYTSTD